MRKILFSSVLFTLVISLSGWGFLVHRTIHQLAIYELPDGMRPFYYKNRKMLVDSAGRPDLRRNRDTMEATRHFIDLEAYGDSSAWKMPMNWEDAVKIYSKDSLLKYGYVPYHIITMKNKLTEAFRSLNKDSILFYSIDLAHYIGDANVPLHTSLNYDGQLTNQRGLHALWESVVPELKIDNYDLYEKHKARYLNNPELAIWDCIRRSNSLLPDVFEMEKIASKNFTDSTKYRFETRRGRQVRYYTPAFATAYSALLKNTINEQLTHSVELIADFWYTAWVDAGRPNLDGLTDFSKADKRAFKTEKKAWKRNELIQKKLLQSRQGPSSSE